MHRSAFGSRHHATRLAATMVLCAVAWGSASSPALAAPAPGTDTPAPAISGAPTPSESTVPSTEPSPVVSPTPTVSAAPTPSPPAEPSAPPTPHPTPSPTADATDPADPEADDPPTMQEPAAPAPSVAQPAPTTDPDAAPPSAIDSASEPRAMTMLAAPRVVFTDVSSTVGSPSYSRFATEIAWLAHTGVAEGWTMADGSQQYRPLDTVARDAMAAFLYRYAGKPAHLAPSRSPFLDVSRGTAFYHEITWTASTKVSTGWRVTGGAEFRAQQSISREAMAAFLYRLAGSPAVSLPSRSPFTDVSPSDPFYKAIVWLAGTGATTGWRTAAGAQFRPENSITRDAMAAFLYRLDRAGVVYTPTTATTTVLRHSTLYVYGTSGLAQRTAPDVTGTLIAYRSQGTAVTPTGTVSSGGWIEVTVNGTRGWMSGYYLAGRDGVATTRVKAEYSNGTIPRERLCTLSWDTGELLLCQAAADLERLNAAFRARYGRTIPINDSYRDYDEQVQARALYGTLAAIPGNSNHGWAAAIDISGSSLPGGYQGAPYLWLRQQLTAYNWVLPSWARPGGSKPEAWHFEYTA